MAEPPKRATERCGSTRIAPRQRKRATKATAARNDCAGSRRRRALLRLARNDCALHRSGGGPNAQRPQRAMARAGLRAAPRRSRDRIIELLRQPFWIDSIAGRIGIQTGPHPARATWMWPSSRPTKTTTCYADMTDMYCCDQACAT